MAMKTDSGSCHCGAVRFTADIDLGEGSMRCNCSICTKARAWFVIVKPHRLQVLAGADAQTEYRSVPPGRPASFLRYRFCKTCGIRTFGLGGDEPTFCFLAVASLDEVDHDELAAAPLKYVDGRHDRTDRAPTDTRLM